MLQLMCFTYGATIAATGSWQLAVYIYFNGNPIPNFFYSKGCLEDIILKR